MSSEGGEIKSKDVIEADKIVQDLKTIVHGFTEWNDVIENKLKKNLSELNKIKIGSASGMKAIDNISASNTKEIIAKEKVTQVLTATTLKQIEAEEKVNKLIANRSKAQKQAAIDDEKVKQSQIKTSNDQLKQEQLMSKVIADQTKEATKKAKQILDENNLYKQQSKLLTDKRNEYKSLYVAGKQNTDEARKLQKEIIDLDKRLKAADAAVGQFGRNVGNYFHEVHHALNELGESILAGFGAEQLAEKIIEFGAESVKAFEESQKAINDLKFAVASLAGEGEEKFNELIEQSEKLSGSLNNLYSPKQLQQAQQRLLELNLTTEQTAEVLPRILDIAARSNSSVEEVTEKLGQALEGNTKGLNRMGISFKSTGNIANDVNGVLKASEKYIGGASSAMNDYANINKEAANKTEMLYEKVGSKLSPSLTNLKLKFLETADSAMEFFSSLGDNNKSSIEIFEEWGLKYVGINKDVLSENQILKKKDADFDKLNIEEKKKRIAALYIDADVALKNNNTHEYLVIRDHLNALNKLITTADEKIVEEKESVGEKIKTLSKKQLDERLEMTTAEYKTLTGIQLSEKGLETFKSQIQKELDLRKKSYDDKIAAIKDGEKRLRELQDENYLAIIQNEEIRDHERIARRLKKDIDDENATKHSAEQKEKIIAELTEKFLFEDEALNQKWDEKRKKEQEEKDKKLIEAQKKLEKTLLEIKLDNDAQNINDLQKQIDKEKNRTDISNEEKVKSLQKLLDTEYNLRKKAIVDKAKAELELTTDPTERLAIANKAGDEINNLDAQHIQENTDLKQKALDEQYAALKENMNKSIDLVDKQLAKESELRVQAFDRDIAERQRNITMQQQLAANGKKNTLAFEEKQLRKDERAKVEEQKKQIKIQENLALLKLVAGYAEKDPNTALSKGLVDFAILKLKENSFAMGVEKLDGPGTETSDSILARLSVNESVITAKGTKENPGLATAMNKGRVDEYFEQKLLPDMMLNMDVNKTTGENIYSSLQYQKLTEVSNKLDQVTEAIKSIPQVSFDVDGFQNIVKTSTEDGMTQVVKFMHKKPRL